MYDDVYEYEIRIFHGTLSIRILCIDWQDVSSQLRCELRSAIDDTSETVIEVYNLWNPGYPMRMYVFGVNDNVIGYEILDGYGLPYPDGPRQMSTREIIRDWF